jgi:hypothetical protein
MGGELQVIAEPSPVGLLLHRYPNAVRITDANRQLPLHICISSVTSAYSSSTRALQDLQIMLNHFPSSLERRDGIDKVYPFMLAAKGDCSSLDVIYFLLLKNPTLVASGIHL